MCDLQEVVPSLVAVEGCVSVAKEGNSYSQNAELKWGDKSLRQSMNYQVLNSGHSCKRSSVLCDFPG